MPVLHCLARAQGLWGHDHVCAVVTHQGTTHLGLHMCDTCGAAFALTPEDRARGGGVATHRATRRTAPRRRSFLSDGDDSLMAVAFVPQGLDVAATLTVLSERLESAEGRLRVVESRQDAQALSGPYSGLLDLGPTVTARLTKMRDDFLHEVASGASWHPVAVLADDGLIARRRPAHPDDVAPVVISSVGRTAEDHQDAPGLAAAATVVFPAVTVPDGGPAFDRARSTRQAEHDAAKVDAEVLRELTAATDRMNAMHYQVTNGEAARILRGLLARLEVDAWTAEEWAMPVETEVVQATMRVASAIGTVPAPTRRHAAGMIRRLLALAEGSA